MDWDIFNAYLESMIELIPKLSKTGIKSTICGPESFTPDHKPIMGIWIDLYVYIFNICHFLYFLIIILIKFKKAKIPIVLDSFTRAVTIVLE